MPVKCSYGGTHLYFAGNDFSGKKSKRVERGGEGGGGGRKVGSEKGGMSGVWIVLCLSLFVISLQQQYSCGFGCSSSVQKSVVGEENVGGTH